MAYHRYGGYMAENAAAVGAATTGESAAPAAEVPELKNVKSKAAREFYMKNVANKTEESKTDEPQPEEQAEPKVAEPKQEEPKPAQQEKQSFDDLLNDEEYKGEFNKRVQDIVQKRLKTAKASEEKLTKLTPLLDLIAHKYGVDLDSTDIDELVQKVTDDDELYEQEALEKGLPVDALKQIRKVESENALLRRAEADRQAEKEEAERRAAFNEQFMKLREEGNAVKAMYDTFDFDTEMRNPDFLRLAFTPGVGVKTAYEIIHKDEIIGGAMQYAAKKAQQEAAASIASNSKRPVEGWTGNNSPANTKIDVSALTSQQRKDYIKRAARGEKITFLD